MEYVLCALVAMVLGIMEGAFAMRWWLTRRRKVVVERWDAGCQRYQAFKAGRNG